MAQTMQAKDAVSAKMAECYVLIPDETGATQRYNLMSAINLEVTMEKNKSEIAILGRTTRGHKATGATISGSAEFYFNTPIWRDLAARFQETGEDVYFDMEIHNEDITASSIGRQSITLFGCNWDSIMLTAFDADSDDPLTESIDFTAESFAIGKSFNEMPGLRA